MSIHKLSAGSGYDYLTRQVAALDATEKGHVGLASYYTCCTLGCSACSCDVRGSATSPGRLNLMLPASDGEARNSGCLPVAVMVGEDAR